MSRVRVIPSVRVEPKYLTLEQAGQYLGGLTSEAVRHMVRNGKLPVSKLGGRLFFRVSELTALRDSPAVIDPVPAASPAQKRASRKRTISVRRPENQIDHALIEIAVRSCERCRKSDTNLYFIETVGADFIKIGIAQDVPKRLAALSTFCPYELRVVGSIRGSRILEGSLHHTFDAFRRNGEWFNYGPTLKAFVARVVLNNPQVAESAQ